MKDTSESSGILRGKSVRDASKDLSSYESGQKSIPLAALLEGNIHHDVPGSDVKSVMAAVAERLPLLSARDKAVAMQAFVEREGAISTAIGDGIAIPHTRSPLVFPLEQAVITLCFLAQPVPFGARDGKPVDIVWTFVSPTIRSHLAMLAKISSALNDSHLRELLYKRSPSPEILGRLKELP